MMEEDWDNLIILDGCRYDLFEETNTIDGELEYRISPGSATPEFLTETFKDKIYTDTVYVTANPIYRTRDLGDDIFYEIIDVWNDSWDDELQTVLPSAMAEATLQAYEKYPNKRIISHFMQPHYPFIGDLAEKLGDHAGYELTYREITDGQRKRDNPTVWTLLEEDKVTRGDVWDAYKENLEKALPHVQKIIDNIQEKTVITSDHGNSLGERAYPFGKEIYGHPQGMRSDVLCKIPWLVIDGERSKEIISEKSNNHIQETSKKVKDRLSDLGYTDT